VRGVSARRGEAWRFALLVVVAVAVVVVVFVVLL
jgi:hypothetical protein